MPSIEQRGPRSWRLIVENGYKPNGQRNQEKITITVDDKALLKTSRKLQDHLELELRKFQMQVESGEYIKPGRVTFDQFVEQTWKKDYAESNLGKFTRKNYYASIRSQLSPEFGHMEIGKIKTMHIVKYMTKLRTPEGRKDGKSKPLATNTLLNIYTALKSIFDAAKKWNFISVNPILGVDRPTTSKKEKREMKLRKKSFTPDEARQAILVLGEEPEHWRLYFIGVLLGGFRRGEMLAVEWSTVDFVAGGIHIEKQITFDEVGNVIEDEVKTVESAAFVPMPDFYMKALQQYKIIWEDNKNQAGARWVGGDKQYLFHAGFGKAFYPDAPTLKWGRLLASNNLPAIRLHDLRHTTAMLLREERVDMKSIQERLRHARLETTSNIYTEKSDLIGRHTADILEKYNPLFGNDLGTKC
ncbi:tyrosine-type recombinase/integrase [Paenibacillus eucommiae]|uniref:Integrase n=1 Tax=Paenibacillus eucommiae TaxID=1355755 RepID=A0ABS4IY54_9BACL|nr:site-specific integrase [Paenibacillus eucommiae]MBP1992517.1 integrase [Paenibacillus eucommiae]